MRGLIWIPSLTACWFGLGGCFFVHDDDCASNADCHPGRTCERGQCVDAAGTSGGLGGSSSIPMEEPSCQGYQGTFVASISTESAVCLPAQQSFSAVFGATSLLEQADGRNCVLTEGGSECQASVPDTYVCERCAFNVSRRTVLEQGLALERSAIAPANCRGDCENYCCSTSSATYPGVYWLP